MHFSYPVNGRTALVRYAAKTHCLPLQNLVKTPIVSIHKRPFRVDLGAQPPVSDKDLLLRTFQSICDGTHVTAAVHKPAGIHGQTFRSERIEPVLLNETPSCRNTPNKMRNRNLKGQHFKKN